MSMGFEGSIFGGGCAKVRAAVAAEAIDVALPLDLAHRLLR